MVAKGDSPTTGERPLTNPNNPVTFQDEEAPMTIDDGYYEEYMLYGDGAIVALKERESEETIISGGTSESVRENLESALWKWFHYVFGGEANENHEPTSQSV